MGDEKVEVTIKDVYKRQKRNRCSISPVELILQSGVRTFNQVDFFSG